MTLISRNKLGEVISNRYSGYQHRKHYKYRSILKRRPWRHKIWHL